MNSNHLCMHDFSKHTPFGTAQWGDWFHEWSGSSKVANTLMYQALSQCQSKHQLPSPSLYKPSANLRVPVLSQCQPKHQLLSPSLYKPSSVHQSAGIQRMPACCRAKHCHCVSLILTPFSLSSQTFSGSSGCQQTAMPGAVSLNIMLPSPFWLHTRHVLSLIHI